MPRGLPEGSLLLLDACCLINLLATGRIEEILQRLPYRFATSRYVATQEILSVPRNRELENLALMDLSSEREIEELVRFAMDLDDGEASVCALAVCHGGTVATDDRKALRILARTAPQVATLQTPEIFWEWGSLSGLAHGDIGESLRAVRDRARFYPRRDAPGFEWWDGFFR